VTDDWPLSASVRRIAIRVYLGSAGLDGRLRTVPGTDLKGNPMFGGNDDNPKDKKVLPTSRERSRAGLGTICVASSVNEQASEAGAPDLI
jgi:hypothetical protein